MFKAEASAALLSGTTSVAERDSILPCSHMATLQLSGSLEPVAVWERSAF